MDYYSRDRYRSDDRHRRSGGDRRQSRAADNDFDDAADDDRSGYRRRSGSSGGRRSSSRRREDERPSQDDYYHRRRGGGGGGGGDYHYRRDPDSGRGGRYNNYDNYRGGYRARFQRGRYGGEGRPAPYYRFEDQQQQQQQQQSQRYSTAYYQPPVTHQPSMPVSAYEPILCPRYNWSLPDCREANCKLLHICRSWLGGECTKADCKLSHSLADDHNWPKFLGWLSEQDLSEMVPTRESASTNHRLRAWLSDKLPKICPSSLVPRLVCNSPRCRDLHVCVNIVKTGQCRYRQHCASPYHSLFTQRNMEVLRQHYPSIAAHVDPSRPLEEQAWLSDVLKNDMDKPAPAGFDEHHFKLRGLTIDTVQLCVNYGEGRGECQSPGCRDLHVCRAWLGGACPNGRSCRWVHGFTREVMLKLEPLAEGRPLTCQYNVRDNLKVVFPCTCCYYNTERGCQRGSNNCDYLHLCNDYVRGISDCRCPRNHDPYDMSVPHRLSRKGVNVAEKDQRVLLRNVLYADFRLKKPCPVCSGGRGSSSSSSNRGSRAQSQSRSRSGSRSRSQSPSNISRGRKPSRSQSRSRSRSNQQRERERGKQQQQHESQKTTSRQRRPPPSPLSPPTRSSTRPKVEADRSSPVVDEDTDNDCPVVQLEDDYDELDNLEMEQRDETRRREQQKRNENKARKQQQQQYRRRRHSRSSDSDTPKRARRHRSGNSSRNGDNASDRSDF